MSRLTDPNLKYLNGIACGSLHQDRKTPPGTVHEPLFSPIAGALLCSGGIGLLVLLFINRYITDLAFGIGALFMVLIILSAI